MNLVSLLLVIAAIVCALLATVNYPSKVNLVAAAVGLYATAWLFTFLLTNEHLYHF